MTEETDSQPTTDQPQRLATTPGSPPEWMEDIIDALEWADGIDAWTRSERDGDTIFIIQYGEELLEFTAGNDGESRGAKYDGGVHDLTDSEKMQWWIACQLYDRLQRAKRDLLEATASK